MNCSAVNILKENTEIISIRDGVTAEFRYTAGPDEERKYKRDVYLVILNNNSSVEIEFDCKLLEVVEDKKEFIKKEIMSFIDSGVFNE